MITITWIWPSDSNGTISYANTHQAFAMASKGSEICEKNVAKGLTLLGPAGAFEQKPTVMKYKTGLKP